MNAESKKEYGEKIWKKFLSNHWKMLIVFIIELFWQL